MRVQSTDEIRSVLNDLDFPASKEQVVEHARRASTSGSDAERALAALPVGEYANVGEVLRSVPVDPAPERTESERMEQHLQHRKPLLAEHMRDSELPPVEEELRGE
jgi:uncharacterized protein DUF2795